MKKTNNDFAKNIFIVSMGPILSSVVSFLAEPWIARFWEPYKFGQVSYYNSILLMLAPLLFLRYNFAIVQAEDEKEKHNLFGLCTIVMTLVIVAISMLYPLLDKYLSVGFRFSDYIWIFFPTLFFASINSLLHFWSSSKKHFIALTLSTIIFQTSNTILLLLFGFFGKNSSQNIVYIRSISYMLAPAIMIFTYLKFDFKDSLRLINFSSMWKVLKKYKRFPLYDFWGTWVGTISFHIPTIFIVRYWGQATNGLYSKASSIVFLLVLFIGDAVNRVFHKEVADMVNDKKAIAPFVADVISTLTQISILPFVLLILAGPEIFGLVLGDNWLASGYYARAISLWMLASLISTSVRPLYGVLNKQLQHSVYTATLLIVRIAVFMLMAYLGASALNTVIVFATVSMVLIIFQFSFIIKLAGVSLRRLGWMLLNPILMLMPMVIVFFAGKFVFKLGELATLVWVSLLSLPYLYLFYYKQESVKNIIDGLINAAYNKFIVPIQERWF